MKDIYSIIMRPIITEKSNIAKEESNQYVFKVRRDANKIEIRHAVEKIFKVDVVDVRTIRIKGKMRRVGKKAGKRPDWKKSIVTVKEGQSIQVFEGV